MAGERGKRWSNGRKAKTMRKALVATILVCALLTASSNAISSTVNAIAQLPAAQHSALCPVGRF